VLVTALDRKLLRESTRLMGQVITIALVLASGITSFIALRGTYASLEWSREAYYDRSRFAHIFATLERAPEHIARRIEALPGVAVVQTRIVKEVSVPIEGMPRPAYGRILSLPPSGEPATNALVLRSGRFPERGRDDEVVLLDSFANAHGLGPGNRVPVVINGKLRQLRIVGVALSPEYVYAIRPGMLVDDPKRYAVLWMERSALAAAFSLDGAFNEVSVRLQPGASDPAIRSEIDSLLAPYGGNGAIARKYQLSNKILTDELGQLKTLGGMVPLVFLGVSAFLINLVLGRLVALQRPEIATLKAVGYSNGQVGLHYLGLVALVMVPASLLGTLGGWTLGRVVLGLYGTIFRFPDLWFHLSASLVASAVLVSALAAVGGALLAVRNAVRMPPAEAMRPPAPAHYGRGLMERLHLGVLMGPNGMMVLREVTRRPLRTALSAVGIAGAVALVILGRFGLDSLNSYLEGSLLREQRQDLTITFVKPQPPRVVGQAGRLPGAAAAEGMRAVPVRVRHLNQMRDTVLLGMPPQGDLRRLIERDGHDVEIPPDGVLLTNKLGEVLGLRVGDRPEVAVLEGERPTIRPVIAGFIDETVGMQIYARRELVANLVGDEGAISQVLLKVNSENIPELEERLSRSPNVIDVSDLPADIERLRDMNASMMDVWTFVTIVLAICVTFGVVYNNARIALAMRSRDLASLRVLGFSRREISLILIGGLTIEVAIAIPAGLILGRLWSTLFMKSVDQEMFRWAVFVAPKTYLMATVTAMVAAAASALWVRRSLDRLDLIGVLKTRE
jgi:putative ABC transport system permease protein